MYNLEDLLNKLPQSRHVGVVPGSYKPPLEIERKYAVVGHLWRNLPVLESLNIQQGYMTVPDADDLSSPVVRVRVLDTVGYITIKGHVGGVSCSEFEYKIPHGDALHMLQNMCGGRVVQKTRHVISAGETMPGLKWEVDEFHGANAGLVVAELEIPDPNYVVQCPAWIIGEATPEEYRRLSNYRLAVRPFVSWPAEWRG